MYASDYAPSGVLAWDVDGRRRHSRAGACSPSRRPGPRTGWRWTRRARACWWRSASARHRRARAGRALDARSSVPAPASSPASASAATDMRDLYVTTGDGELGVARHARDRARRQSCRVGRRSERCGLTSCTPGSQRPEYTGRARRRARRARGAHPLRARGGRAARARAVARRRATSTPSRRARRTRTTRSRSRRPTSPACSTWATRSTRRSRTCWSATTA